MLRWIIYFCVYLFPIFNLVGQTDNLNKYAKSKILGLTRAELDSILKIPIYKMESNLEDSKIQNFDLMKFTNQLLEFCIDSAIKYKYSGNVLYIYIKKFDTKNNSMNVTFEVRNKYRKDGKIPLTHFKYYKNFMCFFHDENFNCSLPKLIFGARIINKEEIENLEKSSNNKTLHDHRESKVINFCLDSSKLTIRFFDRNTHIPSEYYYNRKIWYDTLKFENYFLLNNPSDKNYTPELMKKFSKFLSNEYRSLLDLQAIQCESKEN